MVIVFVEQNALMAGWIVENARSDLFARRGAYNNGPYRISSVIDPDGKILRQCCHLFLLPDQMIFLP